MVVKEGDRVKVDYVLSVDGEVYDTSMVDVAKREGIFNVERLYEPLAFEVGSKEIIKGLNEGIMDMSAGEEKVIVVAPPDGYGYRDEAKVQMLPRALIERSGVDITPGTRIRITTQKGVLIAVVTDLTEDSVTFDLNPDLCGKTLVFNVLLRDVLA